MSATTEPRDATADHPAVARRWDVPAWLAPLALCVFAGTLLFARLGEPPRIIFDETYYVNDARSFLETGGVEESFAVHPPVGKWMIATSIRLLGDDPFGWRASGAVAGIAIVLLTWLLAQRLLRHRWQAVLAVFLLITDGLFLVQSRTAMLDIHLALFVLLGAYLLTRDLQDLDARARTAGGQIGRSLRWRWLAGVAFGLAAATKWSGLLAIGAGLVLVVGYELLARRRLLGSMRRHPARLAWAVVAPLLLVPIGTYVVTYVPWLAAYEHTTEGQDDCREATDAGEPCTYPLGARVRGLVREHVDIARFHRDLESTHAYRAEPWTWPVMGRPIAYYYESCPDEPTREELGECEVEPGQSAEVLALGNPALWWGFLALLPLLTAAMGRRHGPTWVLAGFYGGLVVPWLLVARPAFFFYMAPSVPFMALGVGAAMGRLRERPRDGVPWLAGATAGLVAAVSARVAGAAAAPAAMAFAFGWVFAPMGVAAALERRRLKRAVPDHGGKPVEEPEVSPPSALPAVVTSVVLALLALGLLVWFLPVWFGIPIDADALRARWWFDTWI